MGKRSLPNKTTGAILNDNYIIIFVLDRFMQAVFRVNYRFIAAAHHGSRWRCIVCPSSEESRRSRNGHHRLHLQSQSFHIPKADAAATRQARRRSVLMVMPSEKQYGEYEHSPNAKYFCLFDGSRTSDRYVQLVLNCRRIL